MIHIMKDKEQLGIYFEVVEPFTNPYIDWESPCLLKIESYKALGIKTSCDITLLEI